ARFAEYHALQRKKNGGTISRALSRVGSGRMKNFLQLISLLLPWQTRRALLEQQFGFQIHPTAHIGLAWVLPSRLIMEENTSIGHFTVAKNLSLLHLKAHATIGRGNWINGFPLGDSHDFLNDTLRWHEKVNGEYSYHS